MTSDPLKTTLSNDLEFTGRLPKHIARFRIERILGQGGFGVVYLGHDSKLDRPVAIKVPHPQFVEREEDRELYLKEARMLAGFEHPNIVPVLEVGSTPEHPIYIVSKFIEGSDLAKQLERSLPSRNQAAQWMIGLADAFREAHRKGFVHRDVKPQNIMVDRLDRVYLVDFGLALREEDIGKRLPAGGTPTYMSPEQARGEGHRVDGRSDLFSLGVVFYEMLAGRRPFQGSTKLELFEQITELDPKPLRQWDDAIAPELERICFKMLAKRKSERYSSASDLATDLKIFLEKTNAEGVQATQARLSPTPVPWSEALKVVPKGLRSFDEHDSDFFLELLPGARDREGLPESIRFWKHRIEEFDEDKTFSVGLIYGPSGCGKSSFVKAGLLPRLDSRIISLYVEASADDTESRLLRGVTKLLPNLSESASLPETLKRLRQRGISGERKLLIVLDQFEQWLHTHANVNASQLVDALRQCDGGNVQCIVLVRDEFWLAVSRFMQALENRLIEGHNSTLVDLFDREHAKKVLMEFGRSFGRLPSDPKEVNSSQRTFVDTAIQELNEDGKVVSVRLALFAEMMKSKEWSPATLRAVGGIKGIGKKFLEETFTAPTAPPEHRYHQKAAKAILKSLLPDAESSIKGNMMSLDGLEAATGCSRRKDFEAVMQILEHEVRLITPTDHESTFDTQPVSKISEERHQRYFQLTHDYLVPTLRIWLDGNRSIYSRFVNWCQQPERILNAGTAFICFAEIGGVTRVMC